VVAASRLPDQLKTAVRDMLLGLGRNAETEPALARGFIQGSSRSAMGTTTASGHAGRIHAVGYTTLR
jgi:hypothetical protein